MVEPYATQRPALAYCPCIEATYLTWDEFVALLRSPFCQSIFESDTGRVLVVAVDPGASSPAGPVDSALVRAIAGLPVVTIAALPPTLAYPSDWPLEVVALADLVLPADGGTIEHVLANIAATPLASTSLTILLRASDQRTVADGLAAESAVYSMLQAGPEFARWKAARHRQPRPPDDTPTVRTRRHGSTLDVILSRPSIRNALNRQMRDELLAALATAAADPCISRIELSGEGANFCSGGDLDEFGSFPDPATAHVVRLSTSIGRVIDRLGARVVARLHGACHGSGIELPAFASHVIAAPDTTIRLPEIGLGLIPGAGGTFSITRRIGRHRTLWLALSGATIDAHSALEWGLVDALR